MNQIFFWLQKWVFPQNNEWKIDVKNQILITVWKIFLSQIEKISVYYLYLFWKLVKVIKLSDGTFLFSFSQFAPSENIFTRVHGVLIKSVAGRETEVDS